MENKTCGLCLKEQPTKEFSKKQNNCKTCRNSKAKNKYDADMRVELYRRQKVKQFLDERTPIRNYLLRDCVEHGFDIGDFNRLFVKAEEFNEIKENPDFEFVHFEDPNFAKKGTQFGEYALDFVFATKFPADRVLRNLIYII